MSPKIGYSRRTFLGLSVIAAGVLTADGKGGKMPAVHLDLIPAPTTLTRGSTPFTVTRAARVQAPPQAARAAAFLTRLLGLDAAAKPHENSEVISLTLGGPEALGQEGYRLRIDGSGILLNAHTGEGLFRGVQTLRQLAPAAIETQNGVSAEGWIFPGVQIEDRPRFAWRGVLLDVARHFFSVTDVKRFIDLATGYKINTLHLHLTDDQGWRIAIDSWPRLAEYGGGSEVGGGPGGFYTQAEYAEIVAYAAERYITVVPEIDVPGHVNAALASYPALTADGTAPERYTGIKVGFSSLVAGKEITYRFLDDVVREIAALTPGPYLHLGGDEAHSTQRADYQAFMERAGRIVAAHGKTLVGWQEIAVAPLPPGSVAQYWRPAHGSQPETEAARAALRQGAKLVMSPAPHTYLDLKYTHETRLGLDWAGTMEVRKAYDWDPATYLDGVSEPDILGVEAALWTETLTSWSDLAYMALPRLPGIAEVAWSSGVRQWPEYAGRLARQAPRWTAAGLPFYASPQVDWV